MSYDNLKSYDLVFSGLSEGEHVFEFEVKKEFFEHFGYTDINDSDIIVKASMQKRPTILCLDFKAEGELNVNCDTTNEPFDMPLKSTWELTIKFGESYNDEDDDIIVLPHGEHKVNLAQQIYDWLVLSIPAKRVHPGLVNGTLQSEMVDLLKKYSVDNKDKRKEGASFDERWNKLKEIQNKN